MPSERGESPNPLLIELWDRPAWPCTKHRASCRRKQGASLTETITKRAGTSPVIENVNCCDHGPGTCGTNALFARTRRPCRPGGPEICHERSRPPRRHGVSRRKVLECMTWAGTGVLWTITGGVPRSLGIVDSAHGRRDAGGMTFLQISDSHVGFDKPANPECDRHAGGGHQQDQGDAGKAVVHDPHRRRSPICRRSASSTMPTASSRRPSSTCITCRASTTSSTRRSSSTSERYGRGTKGARLVFASMPAACISSASSTSSNLKGGGLGSLGDDQLEWLEDDLKGPLEIHAGRAVRTHPAVDGLSAMGLGHRGRRPRAGLRQSASARSRC